VRNHTYPALAAVYVTAQTTLVAVCMRRPLPEWFSS
jgi:hypothetical protein